MKLKHFVLFMSALLLLSGCASEKKYSGNPIFPGKYADPEGVIDAVLIRYSDGRDVVTGYKEAINSVSKENIRNILQLVSYGAEVEYIIE